MDGEPTEELDAITDEIPLAPELLGDMPMESERENNGRPLMWFGVAAVLLIGAVAAIVWIGQNRDDATDSVDNTIVEDVDGSSTEVTPPIGDPAAGAAGDVSGNTADTSPPDEGAASTETSTPETSTPEADGSETTSSATTAEDPATDSTAIPGIFIDGVPQVTTTGDDFEIAVSTLVCTTIEWSFTGEGQSAGYTSEQLCFDDHLLSPRPEHPLLPGTTYQVTAIFSAEGTDQVLVLDVTTEG